MTDLKPNGDLSVVEGSPECWVSASTFDTCISNYKVAVWSH